MSSNYASYQMGTPAPESQLSQAEREEITRQLRTPGKVSLHVGSNEGVKFEEAVSKPAITNEDRSANWVENLTNKRTGQSIDLFNHPGVEDRDILVWIGNDQTDLATAKREGLVYRNGKGEWINKLAPTNPTDPQQPTAKQDAAEGKGQQQERIGWKSDVVDEVMSNVGSKLPSTVREGLIAFALDGETALSPSQAGAIASNIPGMEPGQVQAEYQRAYNAAVDAATAVVEKVGLKNPDEFFSYLDNDRNQARHIRDSFVRGNAKPLADAAKSYIETHGAGVDAATEARLLNPANKVRGGRLYRNDRGTVMVQIDGLTHPITLSKALALGYVRTSEDQE
jgi:hypothetical protein